MRWSSLQDCHRSSRVFKRFLNLLPVDSAKEDRGLELQHLKSNNKTSPYLQAFRRNNLSFTSNMSTHVHTDMQCARYYAEFLKISLPTNFLAKSHHKGLDTCPKAWTIRCCFHHLHSILGFAPRSLDLLTVLFVLVRPSPKNSSKSITGLHCDGSPTPVTHAR